MSLYTYHTELKKLISGGLPVLDGTIDEILDQEGESKDQFICVAPDTVDKRQDSDSLSFSMMEVHFTIGIYVTLGRNNEDKDVAFELAMTTFWETHQSLRNQMVDGYQVILDDGAGRITETGSNHERYEIPLIININEDTAPCSQSS